MKKRIIVAIIAGSLLGVFCVFGAQYRHNGELDNLYLFGYWFNRALMGLVVGLFHQDTVFFKRIIRGTVIGLLVSFSFYSASEYKDFIGFLAGGIYGIIIELVLYQLDKYTTRREIAQE